MAKLSHYTHEVILPDGKLLLTNLLWSTFIELTLEEQAEWKLIKCASDRDCEALKARLSEKKILLDDEIDELRLMRTAYQKNRHSPDVLGLTIAPTIDCNLACTYCYENKRKGGITPSVEAQIREYVDRNLPGRKKFNVIWYGGEPLIHKNSVLALSRFFFQRAKELQVSYTAQMTTNALLLTPETARDLADIGGWKNIQITLDGTAEFHDVRRPAKGGQRTFDRIYSNLIGAVGSLPISLRMNVDSENEEGCLQLIERLSIDVQPEKIRVYFAPIHSYGKGCRDVAETEGSNLDHEAFALLNLRLTARARQLGFNTINEFQKKPVQQCQAVSTHSVIVEPDGSLQRCWTEVGEDDKRIGHIASSISIDDPQSLRWLKFDPTAMDPCQSCDVLPSCFGGCPQRHLDGRPMEMICAAIRFNTKAALLADYIGLFRPDLSNSLPQTHRLTSSCSTCQVQRAL